MIMAGVFDKVAHDFVTDLRGYRSVEYFKRDVGHFLKNPMLEWRKDDMVIITYRLKSDFSVSLEQWHIDEFGQLVLLDPDEYYVDDVIGG